MILRLKEGAEKQKFTSELTMNKALPYNLWVENERKPKK